MNNGVQEPFTFGSCESVLGALHSPPIAIKQHLTFHINFHELAVKQVHQNWEAANPDIMEEMLLGTDQYSDLISQLTTPDQDYWQMASIVKQA